MAARRLYSVGYEGLTLGGFVERLAQLDITVLVDVRLNAASRRPGFAKKALAAGLGEAGIRYVHEPLLGNPPQNRASFRRGDGAAGRAAMRERLEHGSRIAIDGLLAEARSSRVAVMCVERDHMTCHRQVITDMLEELDPELEVVIR